MGNFTTRDFYFDKAKAGGFKARSVFKLEEIDKSLKLIKTNSVALDLGCAPGSWLQYLAKKIGPHGAALGIDLTEVKEKFHNNIKTIQGDCFDLSLEKIAELMSDLQNQFNGLDIVLSDMAPKTCGIKHVDQIRSLNLAEKAFEIAKKLLKPGGHVVIKVFDGGEVSQLVGQMKKEFKIVRHMRPKSVRSVSKEFYVVGYNKK
ncbi:MAG: RlmE family RNA methyltransferase [Myxococcales bacterium]|nr:RlmE family RNA methyltransferase [Myxococcales bacterium]USN51848.1 MAG: RlmE family RNA methyltransferase [Myxococcales bacterium]